MNLIQQHIQQVQDLCKKYKVKELYAFGSVLDEHRFNKDSDVDLLVQYAGISEYDYAANAFEFEESLSKILGRDVETLNPKYLQNRFFIREIENTKKLIYKA